MLPPSCSLQTAALLMKQPGPERRTDARSSANMSDAVSQWQIPCRCLPANERSSGERLRAGKRRSFGPIGFSPLKKRRFRSNQKQDNPEHYTKLSPAKRGTEWIKIALQGVGGKTGAAFLLATQTPSDTFGKESGVKPRITRAFFSIGLAKAPHTGMNLPV